MMLSPRLVLLTLLLTCGCGGAIRGTTLSTRPTSGPPRSTATTSDVDGLVVLANGRGRPSGTGPWLASNDEQLAALWADVGSGGPTPDVDFRTHVVIGEGFDDGVCQPELVAVDVDANGVVSTRSEPLVAECILLAVDVSRAVTVPRVILPARFTWLGEGAATQFELPPLPETPETPVANGRASLEGPIDAPLGTVELPAPGTLVRRPLDDGTEVWVAHLSDGRVSVVATDVASAYSEVHDVVAWNARTQRFQTEHDVMGRSLHGRAPLDVHAFVRVGEGRIAIGERVTAGRGAVEPRANVLGLEGGERPYSNGEPVPAAEAPEGRVVTTSDSLVFGLEGPPRFCTLPAEPKLRAHGVSCSEDAPRLAGAPSESRVGTTVHDGPLVIRRVGSEITRVVRLLGGSSGWAVEHRLQAAAPQGPSRARGEIAVDVEARGSTRGANDGWAPSCVAAGGSPDETWDFVATSAGRYAFEASGDYDVAIATSADASELGCNDDRGGFYRASTIHLDLEAGQRVRVHVDGFGGQSGSYTLRVHREPPLENGGVVTLDAPVHGDTSTSTNDGRAPTGDDEWTFVTSESGRYRIVVETSGWSPELAVFAEGATNPFTNRVSRTPLVDDLQLEPGRYRLVVDGARSEAAGPYSLRVTRLPP